MTVTVASKLTPRRRRPGDDELEESRSSEQVDDSRDDKDRHDGMGLVGILAVPPPAVVVVDDEVVDTVDIKSSSTWP